jgi:hypothetical protein
MSDPILFKSVDEMDILGSAEIPRSIRGASRAVLWIVYR